jgi:hypothetical protein
VIDIDLHSHIIAESYNQFLLLLRGGKCHDQGDAKWIVIRGQLWGHNDTPFGWPTPGRPPRGWPPEGRIWWFKLLLISNRIFQHCPPDRGIHLDFPSTIHDRPSPDLGVHRLFSQPLLCSAAGVAVLGFPAVAASLVRRGAGGESHDQDNSEFHDQGDNVEPVESSSPSGWPAGVGCSLPSS